MALILIHLRRALSEVDFNVEAEHFLSALQVPHHGAWTAQPPYCRSTPAVQEQLEIKLEDAEGLGELEIENAVRTGLAAIVPPWLAALSRALTHGRDTWECLHVLSLAPRVRALYNIYVQYTACSMQHAT